ncbi:MAG: ATP phosphoribosyltransferase regulatory subunit [Emergencia sp.]
MISKKILKNDERAVLALRKLYRKHGYLPFKMNKFEEYDFYLENKDFISGDKIVTFYDTNGKLMALRPDVTLSVIKQTEDTDGVKHRVYYDEFIYRTGRHSKRFREMKQAGIECIGDLDLYDISEVLMLAADSLAEISDDYVVSISHLGILDSLLGEVCKDEDMRRRALTYIKAKNTHDLERLCRKHSVPEEKTEKITTLVSLYGDMGSVIPSLEKLCDSDESREGLEEIKIIYKIIASTEHKDKFVVDFSIVNDMDYYNNILFQGFLKGISDNVLVGGQYDRLLEKMGRESMGIGFAISLDMLSALNYNSTPKGSLDYLILYDSEDDIVEIAAKSRQLINAGYSVSVQKVIPEKLRYDNIIDMRREGH